MKTGREFASRLDAVRVANEELNVKSEGCYHNGQILAEDDPLSQWDNYDRYFKFYNITRE